MKSSVKALLAVVVCSVSTPIPSVAQVSDDTAEHTVDGLVDHVVATLPSKQFEAVKRFFSAHLNDCWKFRDRDEGYKGFIFTGRNNTYVELWDSGKYFASGYQVAISSSEQAAKAKAKDYFGAEGLMLRHNSLTLFTVGREGMVGHSQGGTFFVSYGNRGPREPHPERTIAELVGIISANPGKRMDVAKDYQFFGFTLNALDDGFIATDASGFTVRVVEVSENDPESFGHVALHFRLAEATPQRKEANLLEDGSIRAVMDGKDFWLMLQPKLFASIDADSGS